jgi:probable rRNA maturation factor
MTISILIEEEEWRRRRGLAVKLRQAARRALAYCGRRGSLVVLLADDSRLKVLNRVFRGKNKPTNVLSFPAADNAESYLGDIAIAYGVTAAEAARFGRPLAVHACHLVVHGVLHLAGYDHILPQDAEIMERAEVAILFGLGISDPYVIKDAKR